MEEYRCYQPDQFYNGAKIGCPACNQFTPAEQWRETEIGCEDCGEHPAVICPECEETHDLIYASVPVIRGQSCSIACSPSDYKDGGKCDKNECLPQRPQYRDENTHKPTSSDQFNMD